MKILTGVIDIAPMAKKIEAMKPIQAASMLMNMDSNMETPNVELTGRGPEN